MRNALDFSSWQAILSTLLGLVVVSLVAVGIRLLVMHGVQQRRERQNRQINERLKTLIAAYRTLGGSFTGNLAVDPSHLRQLDAPGIGSERRRRVRDAVEAALSDVVLLGTQAQVRMAAQAASEMAAGREIETAALVASLRTFIRDVLDLEPIPAHVSIPNQGPLRVTGSAGRSAAGNRDGGKSRRGGAAAETGDGAMPGAGLHQDLGDEEAHAP